MKYKYFTLNDFGITDYGEKTLYAKSYIQIDTSTRVLSYQSLRSSFYGLLFDSPGYDYRDQVFIQECTKSGMLYGQLYERLDACFQCATSHNYGDPWVNSGSLSSPNQQWSTVFHNLPEDQKTPASLLNAASFGSTGAFGISVWFSLPRSALGYYNQEANWQIQLVDQNGTVKYNNISYNYNASGASFDTINYVNSRVDTAPHDLHIMFFVQKGDKISFRYGFNVVGRDLETYPFGFVTNSDTYDNDMVVYYIADGFAIY